MSCRSCDTPALIWPAAADSPLRVSRIVERSIAGPRPPGAFTLSRGGNYAVLHVVHLINYIVTYILKKEMIMQEAEKRKKKGRNRGKFNPFMPKKSRSDFYQNFTT